MRMSNKWLACLAIVALSSCGNCRSQPPSNQTDVGDVGVEDMILRPNNGLSDADNCGFGRGGACLDASPSGDVPPIPDGAVPGTYDASLTELGEPASGCPVAAAIPLIGDATTPDRFFLPTWKLDPARLQSIEGYREAVHRWVFDNVLPCRGPNANVVIFPEGMSLPMLVMGQTVASARDATDATTALSRVLVASRDAFVYYGQQWEGLELANQLILARTDTVVRAIFDTYPAIAQRYGIWISVTVDLPEFDRSEDPDVIAAVGDPDYEQLDYVWVATSPDVKNRQLLFGPDGTLFDQTEKTYVTLTEMSELNIAVGDFTRIHPMDAPWGRTGVVISKPAWMPDVHDRLEDLGATMIWQPEAFAGGWVLPPRAGDPERWEPDVFTMGGWAMVQKSVRARVDLVPMLTGNYFGIPFDGQVQVVTDVALDSTPHAFVGQQWETPGNRLIAPWAFEDPEDLPLDQRRAALRAEGAKLLPGSGDALEGAYYEGLHAVDISPADKNMLLETHADAAQNAAVTAHIWAEGPVGSRQLITRIGGVEYGGTVGGDVLQPSVAVSEDGLTHVVYEVYSGTANRLHYARYTAGGMRTDEDLTPLVGDWAFHPDVATSDESLFVAFIQRIDGRNRAVVMRGSVGGGFGQSSVVPISSYDPDKNALRASQWDVQLAARGEQLFAVWLDFSTWTWAVRGAYSTDGGTTWSEPMRLDDAPTEVETFHSDPAIAWFGDEIIVVWSDMRTSGRPQSTVAVLPIDWSGPDPVVGQLQQVGAAAGEFAFRPAISAGAEGATIAFEHIDRLGVRSVLAGSWDAAGGFTPTHSFPDDRDPSLFGTQLLAESALPNGAPVIVERSLQ